MAAGLLKSAGAKTSDNDSTATQETSAPVFMSPENMAKTYHNLGNFTLNQKKYSEAVEAYKNSLRLNPKDMETKSNLAYAQKMLKDQQDKQNKQNQDQNKDQNKDQDKDKNKDKNDQNKDKQDPNKDQNKNPEKPQNQQAPPPKITPQAAQQMLQAIQNKENETQDKVKKEKAKLLESRKNEKNW
jgi:tetratricopeptide (TPR) repeat protein